MECNLFFRVVLVGPANSELYSLLPVLHVRTHFVEWFKAYVAHSRQSQVCETQSAQQLCLYRKGPFADYGIKVKSVAALAACTAPYVGVYPGSRRDAKQKDRIART
jgi:hypothetical protein